MINEILNLSDSIRYVAIYQNKKLISASKNNTESCSSSESDKYEELILNPTLITAATQRGDIDCGGLDYILIKYGNFFQLIFEVSNGHISIAIDKASNPINIENILNNYLKGIGNNFMVSK